MPPFDDRRGDRRVERGEDGPDDRPPARSEDRRAWRDRGYVTAETAVVVPSLVLLVAILLWGLMAAAALIQCVDGARAGARAAARSEPREAVLRAVRSVAPSGATVELVREGELVRVRVEASSAGPGPLSVPLRAEAVAWAERAAQMERTARAARAARGARMLRRPG